MSSAIRRMGADGGRWHYRELSIALSPLRRVTRSAIKLSSLQDDDGGPCRAFVNDQRFAGETALSGRRAQYLNSTEQNTRKSRLSRVADNPPRSAWRPLVAHQHGDHELRIDSTQLFGAAMQRGGGGQ